mmetsp:Transcript_32593/g.53188  ORF Transcript_32593/g.53188 Transcript_32593/m.53188 type:complete len:109 (-) Transcript_32593:316-642(-)
MMLLYYATANVTKHFIVHNFLLSSYTTTTSSPTFNTPKYAPVVSPLCTDSNAAASCNCRHDESFNLIVVITYYHYYYNIVITDMTSFNTSNYMLLSTHQIMLLLFHHY